MLVGTSRWLLGSDLGEERMEEVEAKFKITLANLEVRPRCTMGDYSFADVVRTLKQKYLRESEREIKEKLGKAIFKRGEPAVFECTDGKHHLVIVDRAEFTYKGENDNVEKID